MKNIKRRGELVRPRRKNSLRLKGYDYHLPGPYFVTVCTHNRLDMFDESIRNAIIDVIKIVGAELSVRIHCLVVAMNHIHILFSLPDNKTISVPKFMAIIKVRITQFIQKNWVDKSTPTRIWQRSYYDHVIRDENDFLEKARYIENHPIKEEGNIYAEWH